MLPYPVEIGAGMGWDGMGGLEGKVREEWGVKR